MNRKELKTAAKSQIKGNIGSLFVISIVVYLISLVPNCIPLIGSLVSVIVVAPALALGTTRIYIALVGGKKPEVGDVFCGFKDFWLAFKVTFLTELYTSLWSILFVIPGYVKMFSYSMSKYIIAENPNLGANEAITLSRKMMNGHKMEAFVLILSFIPWFFLGFITFGLAFIYIVPYMEATMVNFYNKINPTPKTNNYSEFEDYDQNNNSSNTKRPVANEEMSAKAQFAFNEKLSATKELAINIDEIVEAKLFAQAVELQLLKSPASAKFSSLEEMTVTMNGDAYVVSGYVDSQNSYGAIIRTPFKITVFKDNGTWKNADRFISTAASIGIQTASNTLLYWVIGIILSLASFAFFYFIISSQFGI